MAEKYKAAHVEATLFCWRNDRVKYLLHLEQRIVPKWGDRRLCEIKADQVQQWLFETCDSWHMMNDQPRQPVGDLYEGGGMGLLAGGPAQSDLPRQDRSEVECAAGADPHRGGDREGAGTVG